MKYLYKVIYIALIGLIIAVRGEARTIYVPQGSSIQDSLNVALTGDTVLVGSGTFYEHITWPAVDSIVLISEYGQDSTTINGSGTGRVIYFNGSTITNATKVKGFTITEGYKSYGGAGLRIKNGASPTIEDNLIRENECAYYGAGILVEDSDPVIRENIIENNHVISTSADTGHYGAGILCKNSGALIENNIFRGNRIEDYGKGAGIALRESYTTVRNNRIEEDTAISFTGGGINIYNSADTITDNIVSHNLGTGILATNSDFCLIEKNEITFNKGGLGGGMCLYGSACQIYDNMIRENSAQRGGGIYCYSDAEIVGNSVTSNIADDSTGGMGGGIFVGSANPVIANNIISRNIAEKGTTGDGMGGGIFVNLGTGVFIRRNTIVLNSAEGDSGEGGGIRFIFSTATVGANPANKNNIYHNFANYGSNLLSGIASTCDATHNYWGTSDTLKIAATIDGGTWRPIESLPLSIVKTIPDAEFYTFGEIEMIFVTIYYLGSDSTVEVTIYGDSVPSYCSGAKHIAKFFDLQGNFTFDAFFRFYYTNDEFTASGVSSEDSLHTYRYNGVSWDSVSGTVDTVENAATANSSEFSVWMLGEDILVGVEEDKNANCKMQSALGGAKLEVYPNPFTAGVRVQWSGISEKQKISLQIYDLSGRLVKSFPLTPNPLPLTTAVYGLSAGIYFIKVKGLKPVKVTKLK